MAWWLIWRSHPGDGCRKCPSPWKTACPLHFTVCVTTLWMPEMSVTDRAGDGCRKRPSPIRAGVGCRKCPSPTQPVMDVGNVRLHWKTACPLHSTVCVTTLWMPEMSVTTGKRLARYLLLSASLRYGCRKCPSPTEPVMDVGKVRHRPSR